MFKIELKGIYDFKIQTLKGEELAFSAFRNKKMLLVNVASECGFTQQYTQLQELQESSSEKLVIIGFPCNDFGGQEPGSNIEIDTFCSVNYGVSFDLTEKIGIVHSMHPIYKWLTDPNNNKGKQIDVNWNFCKFLINEDGSIHAFCPSAITPLDDIILDWLT